MVILGQKLKPLKFSKNKAGKPPLIVGAKMKTIYLSGKITGLEKSVYEANFKNAELFYRACGYDVVNPCHISAELLKNNPNADYEDFMKADLKALAGCTHIAMLEGWETSPGARREKAEAKRLGLEIMYLRFIGGQK